MATRAGRKGRRGAQEEEHKEHTDGDGSVIRCGANSRQWCVLVCVLACPGLSCCVLVVLRTRRRKTAEDGRRLSISQGTSVLGNSKVRDAAGAGKVGSANREAPSVLGRRQCSWFSTGWWPPDAIRWQRRAAGIAGCRVELTSCSWQIPSVAVGCRDDGCPRSDTLKAGWGFLTSTSSRWRYWQARGGPRRTMDRDVEDARGGFVARNHNVKMDMDGRCKWVLPQQQLE